MMMTARTLYAAAGLVTAAMPCSPTYSAPVYLKCQLDADMGGNSGSEDLAKSAPVDVTLNEDTGTVTYLFTSTGRTVTVRGAFTVDKVQFNGFVIDRTNLAFEREFFGKVDHGRCALAESKRAF